MVTRCAGGDGPKRRVEAIVNDHLSEILRRLSESVRLTRIHQADRAAEREGDGPEALPPTPHTPREAPRGRHVIERVPGWEAALVWMSAARLADNQA